MTKEIISIVVMTTILLSLGFVAGRATMNPMFNSLGLELPVTSKG